MFQFGQQKMIMEATMIEFTIDPESEFPLIITTGPFVFPEKYPFDKYESK